MKKSAELYAPKIYQHYLKVKTNKKYQIKFPRRHKLEYFHTWLSHPSVKYEIWKKNAYTKYSIQGNTIPVTHIALSAFPLIPFIWARFCLYYFTLHVPLLSPLCPLQVFVWCLLGVLLGCVRGQRPVNVAFALFFILVIKWRTPWRFLST
jgi:hypothetical protein